MIGGAALAAAMLIGCSDGEDPPQKTGSPSPTTLSCTVTLAASSYSYEVGDAGQMLIVGAGLPNEQTLERVSTPTGTIYGTWLVFDQVQNGIMLHGEITFAPGQVSLDARCIGFGKTLHADASSPATITDTTVSVLVPDSDTEYAD
jgi:hypothetical protein